MLPLRPRSEQRLVLLRRPKETTQGSEALDRCNDQRSEPGTDPLRISLCKSQGLSVYHAFSMLADDRRLSASPINLVVALPAEAKPIASGMELERVQPDRGFPLYRRGLISLVVSGPGKANAAAASAFLFAMGGCPRDAIWVNIGTAGHAERQVGETLLAHTITDAGSGRSWCPTITADCPLPADALVTLDRPDLSYRRPGMVDMEASGFYPTVCRFTAVDLVQVIKIVSDNRDNSARGLGAKQIRGLMENSLDELETLIAHLQARPQPANS